MTEENRRQLAHQILTALPEFGNWATSFRDFSTPYGSVGFRQAAILWILRHETIPTEQLSPIRLATHFQVQPSVLTGALAKLEEAKLITRTADRNDSRISRIAITERGRLLSEHVEAFFVNEIFDTLDGLNDDEIRDLQRSVSTLSRIAEVLHQRRVEKLTRRGSQPSEPSEP